ncbi:unnamed protein product [Chrysoparadoxa australica]
MANNFQGNPYPRGMPPQAYHQGYPHPGYGYPGGPHMPPNAPMWGQGYGQHPQQHQGGPQQGYQNYGYHPHAPQYPGQAPPNTQPTAAQAVQAVQAGQPPPPPGSPPPNEDEQPDAGLTASPAKGAQPPPPPGPPPPLDEEEPTPTPEGAGVSKDGEVQEEAEEYDPLQAAFFDSKADAAQTQPEEEYDPTEAATSMTAEHAPVSVKTVTTAKVSRSKMLNRRGLKRPHRAVAKAFGGDSGDEAESNDTESGTAAPAAPGGTAAAGSSNAGVSGERAATISKTAAWMLANPSKASVIMKKSAEDPKLKFLFDEGGETAEGRYYNQIKEAAEAKAQVMSVTSGSSPMQMMGTVIPLQAPQAATFTSFAQPAAPKQSTEDAVAAAKRRAAELTKMLGSTPDAAGEGSGEKKVRKNRWGPVAAVPAAAAVAAAGVTSAPKSQLALPESIDKEKQAQLEQQREMQALEARVRAAQKAQMVGGGVVEGDEAQQDKLLMEERLKEYTSLAANDDDSFRDTVEDAEAAGGIIEGGTWEHRKRAKEMLLTAQKAQELTAASAGKRHLAEYLPKEELDKFLNKADKKAKGETVTEQDYEKAKLDAGNLGFQMLQQAGWQEGAGLGKAGDGIAAPVNAGGSAAEGTGVGTKATHEVEQNDDEFDQYRKRMMLAYRFRPNPLNNPRRAYY